MNTQTISLEQVYDQKIGELFAAEKKYVKCLKKLSAAALTAELKTGLSPAAEGQREHIERLKQCKAIQKADAASALELTETLLNMAGQAGRLTRKPSLLRDAGILHCGQMIMNVKVAEYHALFLMAAALQQDNAALLLEQSWKDNQNAYNYLAQISANIIYPQAINS